MLKLITQHTNSFRQKKMRNRTENLNFNLNERVCNYVKLRIFKYRFTVMKIDNSG